MHASVMTGLSNYLLGLRWQLHRLLRKLAFCLLISKLTIISDGQPGYMTNAMHACISPALHTRQAPQECMHAA
jgi:hypothetical protein